MCGVVRPCELGGISRVLLLQGNIEKLSVEQLDAYKADLWLLAPPCQPYTRRGLQKDADDWRASSFMKLLLKLPQMQVCMDTMTESGTKRSTCNKMVTGNRRVACLRRVLVVGGPH